ncbi:hypothetical protein Scep_023846 [Stephania cephalantha]|uniref:Uncharacterized protein n=1 Tax=Stephania cephalantha TaxID=152367 RepID=A0AAP0EVF5_9MAGN
MEELPCPVVFLFQIKVTYPSSVSSSPPSLPDVQPRHRSPPTMRDTDPPFRSMSLPCDDTTLVKPLRTRRPPPPPPSRPLSSLGCISPPPSAFAIAVLSVGLATARRTTALLAAFPDLFTAAAAAHTNLSRPSTPCHCRTTVPQPRASSSLTHQISAAQIRRHAPHKIAVARSMPTQCSNPIRHAVAH